ncbi:hypothetical protein [Brevibacterium oceani]|uniref:hypothetical protein n=1 Tax=Brevibacterium oceani TaxID=358099 RepID=UPI001B336A5B|nr:hypothetical protein [Brevibacterium oceani]
MQRALHTSLAVFTAVGVANATLVSPPIAAHAADEVDSEGLIAYAAAPSSETNPTRLPQIRFAYGSEPDKSWTFQNFDRNDHSGADVHGLTLSNDGSRVAYVVENNKGTYLQVRNTVTNDLAYNKKVMKNGEYGTIPKVYDISADGERLLTKTCIYETDDETCSDSLVDVDDGKSQKVPTLASDDSIVGFSQSGEDVVLQRTNVADGPIDAVDLTDSTSTTVVPSESGVYRSPGDVSADGSLVFEQWQGDGSAKVQLRSVKVDGTGEGALLKTNTDWNARLSPSGKEALFVRDSEAPTTNHDDPGPYDVMLGERDGSGAKTLFPAINSDQWDWSADPGVKKS